MRHTGISLADTSLQISCSKSFAFASGYVLHYDRFIAERPLWTSYPTSQDAGATLRYHGQFVRLEWQSSHDRENIDCTAD